MMLLSEMTSLRMVSLPILACVIIVSQGEFSRFSTVPARTENRVLKPRQMFRVCLQCVQGRLCMEKGMFMQPDGILESYVCDSKIEI